MKIKIIEGNDHMTIKITGEIGTTASSGNSRWASIEVRTTREHFVKALTAAMTKPVEGE